jgi:surface polysaccharide O-acyltransferase-like enzyme
MVVFLHAHNLSGKGDLLNYYVQNFISNGVTKISVALFFIISGYLFFYNIETFQLNKFGTKIKSRARTILLPYLLWSLWGIFLFLILQALPFSRSFFNADLIVEKSPVQLLHTWLVKPLPYQLWFLRHLFVFVLASPLIYGLAKYARWVLVGLVVLLLLKILDIPDNDFIDNRSFSYFCVGCYLGIYHQRQVLKTWSSWALIALVVWLVLVTFRIGFESEDLINHKVWRNFITQAEFFIGIFAVWSSYDWIVARKQKDSPVPAYLSMAFFLFAAHEPILTMLKKLAFAVLGKGNAWIRLFIYFSVPIATILVCLLFGFLIKKYSPKIFELLTGGRN